MAPRPPSAARFDTQWDFRPADIDAIPDSAFLPSWPIYDDSALLSTTLRRFDISQNVKMRDTRDLPRFYYSFRNHTSMFSQFRKRGNDSSTPLPYRAARCFTRKPIFRFFDSGGVMSSRIASKTTLNCASYFFSRVSSLRARSR